MATSDPAPSLQASARKAAPPPETARMVFRPTIWRTTAFRLTAAYGAGFAIAVVLLLSLIYIDVEGYMIRQMDEIVVGQAEALRSVSAEALPERIRQVQAEDNRGVNYYGLFSKSGEWIIGNVRVLPAGLILDGRPRELRQAGFNSGARALAETLPWGEVLFVGFDAKTLTALRHIFVNSLLWTGGSIILLGLGLGAAFSLGPLSRINAVQEASLSVMHGDLGARLPILGRGDEIDLLAAIANAMMDEVERLLGEVKTVGDNVAHDLRTPLTRLRAGLYRVQQEHEGNLAHQALLDQALVDTDALLGRFKALQRIGEIDRLARQAGFAPVCLADLIKEVAELFTPVAEDVDLTIKTEISSTEEIFADRELLFEVLVNLVRNAVKFTPPGGVITLRVAARAEGPQLQIVDTGPGVPEDERDAVMQRFYRSRRDREIPGSGLGLSIVAAVARLHGYRLALSDAHPGLAVTIDCWPTLITHSVDVAAQKHPILARLPWINKNSSG